MMALGFVVLIVMILIGVFVQSDKKSVLKMTGLVLLLIADVAFIVWVIVRALTN